MKNIIVKATVFLLTLALLAGCGKPQTEQPPVTTETPVSEPAPTTEAPTTVPTTEPTTEATTEPTTAPTEADTEYEGDASSYYIDVVYAQQIDRYYTAISQQWEETTCLDNDLSPLVAHYYDGNPLDNVGFTFMDLDGDGIWELIIGAIANAEQDPLVFEIWALKNDEPVLIAQSGAHNRYYLQYAQEDCLWSVAYEAENGAANHAVYYLQLFEGKFMVIQGIVFDAVANEKAPWFMAYDLDWDVSNDMPIEESTANSVMRAGRNTYTAAEYFPYCLYR